MKKAMVLISALVIPLRLFGQWDTISEVPVELKNGVTRHLTWNAIPYLDVPEGMDSFTVTYSAGDYWKDGLPQILLPRDVCTTAKARYGASVTDSGSREITYDLPNGGTLWSPYVKGGRWYFKVESQEPGWLVTSYDLKVTLNPKKPSIGALTVSPASGEAVLGSPASFTVAAKGTPPFKYQWYRNSQMIAGATSATYEIRSVQLADNGAKFSCKVSNAAGEVDSGSAQLSVVDSARIVGHPQPQSATVGQEVTFSVIATGLPAPAYQWLKNGNSISGATSSSFTIRSVTMNDAGNYSVQVKNKLKTEVSNTARLTVDTAPAAPKILTQPASQTKSVGESATFAVSASGNPPPTYQWRKGSAEIPGATVSSFTIPNLTLNDAGQYSVEVRNTQGSVRSSSATLTVKPVTVPPVTVEPERREPFFVSSPSETSAQVGDPITLIVKVEGNPAPSLQWRKNGQPIPGATRSVYEISNAKLGDSGSYDVVAQNAHGSVTSKPANVTVTEQTATVGIQWERQFEMIDNRTNALHLIGGQRTNGGWLSRPRTARWSIGLPCWIRESGQSLPGLVRCVQLEFLPSHKVKSRQWELPSRSQ